MSNVLRFNPCLLSHVLMLAGCVLLGAASAGCGAPNDSPQSAPEAVSDSPSVYQEAVPLADTTWALIQLQGQVVSMTPDERAPSFRLLPEEDRIVGFGGCNQFGGRYEVQDDSLHITRLVATRMACAEHMDTEEAFLDALTAATTYRIDEGRLTLYRDEERLAVFDARPGAQANRPGSGTP